MTRVRRCLPLVFLAGLTSCSGFGVFLDHTFSLPGENPNLPMADSENYRRAIGLDPDIKPLETEPGNVWPRFDYREPTLADIANNPTREDQRGFPPTAVPGETPGLPAGRQPRPARGSGTPPPNLEPGAPALPGVTAPPPPPPAISSRRPGGVVTTPQGPATDTGGTNSYRQLNTPQGPGAIIVPNGNGTSTIINPDGSVQTVPTPR